MTTPEQPTDLRRAFRQAALDAIPYDLIGSPAVGVGDARRYMLADAMWPVVERMLADARAEGRRQATEGWEREWGVRDADGRVYREDDMTEARARAVAAWPKERPGAGVSRLVGPWEADERVGSTR